MNKCAMLDVNGVIIQNNCNDPKGAYYLLRPEDWVVLEGASEAHKLLHKNKYKIFWVTSQNSITEGLISEGKITDMLHCMKDMFEIYCGYWQVVSEIAIVTNDIVGDDSDPEIRRLKAEVKNDAMRKLIEKYDIDVSQSFGVGDRMSDIDSFEQVALKYKYQILTPYGDKLTQKADACYNSLIECVKDHIKNYDM